MRTALATLGVMLAAALLGGGHAAQTAPERSTQAPANSVESEIRKSIEVFREAFDKGDAAAVAATFTEDGELTDASGLTIRGRKAIAAWYTETFEESPGAKLAILPDSIRSLSPETVIEEGVATVTPAGGSGVETTRYEVIHIKQNGRWLQGRVHDSDEVNVSPHDRLKPLEWLVGDWVDEGDDGVVHTTCAWSQDGNFLLRDFRLQIRGRASSSGTQRLGWDPATRRIKSWIFDTTGTHGEQFWAQEDDGRWIIKSTHTLADGRLSTATNILERTGKDALHWTSRDRTLAASGLPDTEEYHLVRRPPAPK
ncbi:MAG: hypothetical protein JWN86_669 [Planctomycetota bacterium]|nr:hypothetical protein [Planctomycetota bacterium]